MENSEWIDLFTQNLAEILGISIPNGIVELHPPNILLFQPFTESELGQSELFYQNLKRIRRQRYQDIIENISFDENFTHLV
jgi:hypothetical protein